MLIKWSFVKRVVYLLFLIRWIDIIIDTRQKVEREEKHWKVGNYDITFSHKKDWKLWFSYFNVKVKSKWKTWSLCFARLTIRKLQKKKMCKRHSSVVWFYNFRTLCIIVCFTTFGCFSCGRSHLKFSKLEEQKKRQSNK